MQFQNIKDKSYEGSEIKMALDIWIATAYTLKIGECLQNSEWKTIST